MLRYYVTTFRIPLRPESFRRGGFRRAIQLADDRDPVRAARRDAIELIDMCTHTLPRMPIAIAAPQVGKPIICGKPTAIDAGEALRMPEAAARAGVGPR